MLQARDLQAQVRPKIKETEVDKSGSNPFEQSENDLIKFAEKADNEKDSKESSLDTSEGW